MSRGLFEKALCAFPFLEHVELQGEGEPLMHPLFFDMVQALRDRGISVSIITNGSYLSPEHNSRLVALSLSSIRVSIESAEPDEFRRIRGGKFDKVVRGLRNLVEIRNEYRLANPASAVPAIGLAATMLASTIHDFNRILDLYEALGLDDGIAIQALQKMPVYTHFYPEEIRNEEVTRETLMAFLSSLQQSDRKGLIPRTGRDFYSKMRSWDPHRSEATCPWLENGGALMNMNGHVTACCMIKEEKFSLGRIGDDRQVGSIESHVAEGRNEMRAELNAGRCPTACVGCPIIARIESIRPLDYPRERHLPIICDGATDTPT